MEAPVRVEHNPITNRAAFVFIHGFGGASTETWGKFPDFLKGDPRLAGWGIFSLGYSTTIRIDVPGLWTANPTIGLLATSLVSALSVEPFAGCEAIGIAAHSMGGLVAQRAILDSEKLRKKIAGLFLFGTPSGGLAKAWLGALFNQQAADMRKGGPFIKTLRADWTGQFADDPPFFFRAVAGEIDEFVPRHSSLEPFSEALCDVVPGNHLQIVKPEAADHRSVSIVKQGLCKDVVGRKPLDSARLQVELRQFAAAVDTMLPRAGDLDDAALVSLALALDGLGRGDEALQILEQNYRKGVSSTDALGVLAGRVKRRWLVERKAADLQRARQLYAEGLSKAEAASDHAQAYYHSINIAFLDLMSAAETDGVPPKVQDMARRALKHCDEAAPVRSDHWRLATQAEATLMLGDLDKAVGLYGLALARAPSERDKDSMYSQAIRVAAHIFGDKGAKDIEALSGFRPATDNPEPAT